MNFPETQTSYTSLNAPDISTFSVVMHQPFEPTKQENLKTGYATFALNKLAGQIAVDAHSELHRQTENEHLLLTLGKKIQWRDTYDVTHRQAKKKEKRDK